MMSMEWIVVNQIENCEDNDGPKVVVPAEREKNQINDEKNSKSMVHRLVMEFLVTEGYAGAAEKFQMESGTEPGTDLASIRDRMAIKNAVQCGNLEFVLEKLKKSEIMEENPDLAFRLLQQRFIELLRDGKRQEALLFSRMEFSPFVTEHEEYVEELAETVALLAFKDVVGPKNPWKGLLDTSRRLKIASEVNAAILSSQNQRLISQLEFDGRLRSFLRRQVVKRRRSW